MSSTVSVASAPPTVVLLLRDSARFAPQRLALFSDRLETAPHAGSAPRVLRLRDVVSARAAPGAPCRLVVVAYERAPRSVHTALLACGASPDAKQMPELPTAHASALTVASADGRLDVVNVLLAAGADFDATSTPRSLLWWAVERGHVDLVRDLAARGAALEAPDGLSQPLVLAVTNGHADVAAALLAAGSRVDAADAAGMTATHEAARLGDGAALAVLIAAGADVNSRANGNLTPLYAAAANNRLAAVCELLRSGAAVAGHGASPLAAASRDGYADVVRALLAAGAPVDADDGGCTPLQHAAKHRHADVVRILLAAGASTADMSASASALAFALENDHADVVRILLAGADARRAGGDGADADTEPAAADAGV